MKEFELHEPVTVEEAIEALGLSGNPKVLAGGSDIVGGIMKDWVSGPGMPIPEKLIDLATIPELKGISATSSGVTIGAMATLTEVAESEDLAGFPVLTKATLSVASQLIRNFGTLGGNINQDSRCWFFRGENFTCYKNGGDFCYAVTGANQYHAIIDGELCYAVHPSDTATALVALNASGTIAGPSGRREVAFDDYFVGPRNNVLVENILETNEILLDVMIPSLGANTKTAWIKLKNREVYDFAVVSVAVVADIVDGVWESGRIVLGGVAPIPWRATAVEDALAGQNVESTIKQAAALVANASRPLSDNGYKVDIAIGLVERAVMQAMAA
jgi:xanthine dehydrogenase YagS FAD-binding subunit